MPKLPKTFPSDPASSLPAAAVPLGDVYSVPKGWSSVPIVAQVLLLSEDGVDPKFAFFALVGRLPPPARAQTSSEWWAQRLYSAGI